MTRDRGPHLIEVDDVQRRHGCTDLVVLNPTTCANCGATMVTDEAWQSALFWHGGYGETQHGTATWCPACGWQGGKRRESTNPRTRRHKSVT